MLKTISEEMRGIGVPYEFMRWTSAVTDRYWVGEYSETPTVNEDGYKESTMILTGTTRGSWIDLEQDKAKIEQHFPTVYGLRKTTAKGSVTIYYENSFPVETGEADLKRIQVNLRIKEWKGAI